MTNDKTVTMSREKLRQEFEAANSDRAWFVQGGTSESDTPEGFVYGDFTTDMCWTCYFEARQIAAPVVERQEPVGQWSDDDGVSWCDGNERSLQSARESGWKTRTLYAAPVALEPDKYDCDLLPFVRLMRKELHANAGKGDRAGWLAMSTDTALLEIIYHFGKLQASVKRGDEDGIREYAADVANMCMMLVDICACLDKVKELNQ